MRNPMKTSAVRWTACVAAGLVGLTVLSSCAQDEREETMSIDATPAAVRAAIRQHAGDGAVGEVERETENGKTVYEVEAVRDGRKMEYEFAEDGTLLSSGPEEDDDDDAREAGDGDGDDDDDDDKPAAAAKG